MPTKTIFYTTATIALTVAGYAGDAVQTGPRRRVLRSYRSATFPSNTCSSAVLRRHSFQYR